MRTSRLIAMTMFMLVESINTVFALQNENTQTAGLNLKPSKNIKCAQEFAVYKGFSTSLLLEFQGKSQEGGLQGILADIDPSKKLKFGFETEFSNGYSREFISLNDMKSVSSVVMRKNADFSYSTSDFASDYITTPELPVQFYYSTMDEKKSYLHKLAIDDTWKLYACENPNVK